MILILSKQGTEFPVNFHSYLYVFIRQILYSNYNCACIVVFTARPWLIDGLDNWVQKISKEPYKKIAIFIDNSGFDIVLGILPLAREMLRQGATVILCANSAPALNDVTHSELVALLRKVAAICPIVSKGLDDGTFKSMETAQGGPCLDLR